MVKLTKRSEKWMKGVAANVEAASGRSLAAWAALAKTAKMDRDPDVARRWLKAEHGLTIVQARFVLAHLFATTEPDDDALVSAQFSGAKAALRPIYDRLAKLAASFGDDVMVAPRKTQITMARDVTFAVVRAATKTRVDLLMRLPGVAPTKRLLANPKASGVDPTHHVALSSVAEVDAELTRWLGRAYEAARR